MQSTSQRGAQEGSDELYSRDLPSTGNPAVVHRELPQLSLLLHAVRQPGERKCLIEGTDSPNYTRALMRANVHEYTLSRAPENPRTL